MVLNPAAAPGSVAVVIPVINEEESIEAVVRAIPRSAVNEIIVVDGGSRDRTVAVAEAAGARVVVERRRGYGRACASGVVAAASEIVVFMDGDGSDDGADLPRLLEPLRRGEADLVLGARSAKEEGSLPLFARAGNVFAALVISILWRQRISDLPSFKAIRRDDLRNLGMVESTYGWTIELIVKAGRRGLRMREIPLTYHQRIGGVSKVSGNLRASLKAAVAILRVLLQHSLGLGEAGVAGRVALVK